MDRFDEIVMNIVLICALIAIVIATAALIVMVLHLLLGVNVPGLA